MVVNYLPLYEPPPGPGDSATPKIGTITSSPKPASQDSREPLLPPPPSMPQDSKSPKQDPSGKFRDKELNRTSGTRHSVHSFSANYSPRILTPSSFSLSLGVPEESVTGDIPGITITSADSNVKFRNRILDSNCDSDAAGPFAITGEQKTGERQQQQPPDSRDAEPTAEQETVVSSEAATVPDTKEPPEVVASEAEVEESPVKSKDEVTVAETGEKKSRHQILKKESLGSMSDDGSDDEKSKKEQLSVEYVDSPEELTVVMKRSSGSVSFFGAQEDLAPYPAPKSPSPDLPTIEQSMELLSTETSAAAMPPNGSGENSPKNAGGTSPETEAPSGSETTPKSEAGDDVVSKEQPAEEKLGASSDESQEKTASEKEPVQENPAKMVPEGSDTEAKPSSDLEKPPLLADAKSQASQPGVPSAPGSLPSAEGAPPPAQPVPLPHTPLPPPPPTIEPHYMERSGWLTKLSHKKGKKK